MYKNLSYNFQTVNRKKKYANKTGNVESHGMPIGQVEKQKECKRRWKKWPGGTLKEWHGAQLKASA